MSTMEWLFWLQPMMSSLVGFLCMCIILLGVGSVLKIIYQTLHIEAKSHGYSEVYKEKSKCLSWTIPAFIISGLLCCLLSPLAKIDETYKKVLIVRGINSETADKVVSATDRILELAEEAAEAKIKEIKEKN